MGEKEETVLLQPVPVLMRFFHQLEEQGVAYCHFKSNQHLGEALSGETDVDLLVDKNSADRCEIVLKQNGFKRFVSQPWVTYPGIEDWIGYDEEQGKIVHIHLHYQLLSGLKFVKEQHLPWEQLLLKTAERHPLYGVYVTNPHLELILLAVRISIKTSNWQLLKAYLGTTPLPKNIIAEYEYLLEHADPRRVKDVAVRLFGRNDGMALCQWIMDKKLSEPTVIRAIRAMVKRHYREHQRYSGLNLYWVQLARFYKVAVSRLKRKLKLSGQKGKRPHKGGLIIALVGCDGSGKSTLSKALVETLSKKVDIQNVYLGSGDGRVSLSVSVAKSLWALFKRLRGKSGEKPKHGKREKKKYQAAWKNVADALFAVLVANDRYRKLKKARQDKLNGWLIVTDRYPQNQFPGLNDGPYIELAGHETWLERWAARLEQKRFERFRQLQPDLVIKLSISVEVAFARKPVYSPDDIRQKVEIVEKLSFPGAKVVTIDATQPLEQVKKQVTKVVWETL